MRTTSSRAAAAGPHRAGHRGAARSAPGGRRPSAGAIPSRRAAARTFSRSPRYASSVSTRPAPRGESRSGPELAVHGRPQERRLGEERPLEARATPRARPRPGDRSDAPPRAPRSPRVPRATHPSSPSAGAERGDPAVPQRAQCRRDVGRARRRGHDARPAARGSPRPPGPGSARRATADRRPTGAIPGTSRRATLHDGGVRVLEVPAGVRHDDRERPLHGDPQLAGPPRQARAAGLVAVAELEQLVEQPPERGRGAGRDLPLRRCVPVGDRRGRRVTGPEQRVPERPEPVRRELPAGRDPAPQHPAGGQRPVQHRLQRPHGPCLGRRLVAERPECADAGHGTGPQRPDEPVERIGRGPDVVRGGLRATRHVPGDLERERLARRVVAGEGDQGEEVRRCGSFLHGIGRIARRCLPRCCLVLPMVCRDTLATGSCPDTAPGSPRRQQRCTTFRTRSGPGPSWPRSAAC